MRTATLGAIALSAATLAAGLSAQSPRNDVDTERALQMIARAVAMNISEFPQAAFLFERAERMLPAGQREAEAALRSAATIRYGQQKFARAQELLEMAAHHATVRGDAAGAAHTYMQAIFVALKRGRREDARRLVDQVVVLAATPSVPDDERRHLLNRLSEPLVILTAQR